MAVHMYRPCMLSNTATGSQPAKPLKYHKLAWRIQQGLTSRHCVVSSALQQKQPPVSSPISGPTNQPDHLTAQPSDLHTSHTSVSVSDTQESSNSILARLQALVSQTPNRLTGLIMLNVMTLLMGSNWVVVKQSESLMDPFLFSAIRFSLAALALSPALPQALKDPKVCAAGMELGAYAVLGYLTQSEALYYTDASRASLLSTITVLAVPLIARMTGRKIKPIVWICGVGTLIGTAMLEQSGTPPNMGDVLAVASAIFFALQMFRTEILTRNLPPSPFPLASVTLLTIAVGASATAAFHLIPESPAIMAQIHHFTDNISQITHQITHIGQPPPPPPSITTQIASQLSQLPAQISTQLHQIATQMSDIPSQISQLPAHLITHTPATATPLADPSDLSPAVQYIRSLPWPALLYTSLCSTNVVILIEMLALHTVSSTEAAMIYTMEPVEGALLAYWLLGERWGMLGWAGAAIIVSCALATQIGGAEEPTAEGAAE